MRNLALLLLGAAVACAHGRRPAEPTTAERALAERMESIVYEGGEEARVGDVTLGRTSSGAVRAELDGAPPARDLSGERDLATETAIRGKISTDPMLAATLLDVDVDDGVVRISGDLAAREQAARAVTIALGEPGVRAVEARCTWVPEKDHLRLVGTPAARRY